jgi:hypothetical protein
MNTQEPLQKQSKINPESNLSQHLSQNSYVKTNAGNGMPRHSSQYISAAHITTANDSLQQAEKEFDVSKLHNRFQAEVKAT